eukprot:352204_1
MCCLMNKYGRDKDTWHVRVRQNSHGIELHALAQPNERNSIHNVIAHAAHPGINRGLSVPMGSLYEPEDGGSGSGEMIMMAGYDPHDTLRDLDDSEQSMERATFIE